MVTAIIDFLVNSITSIIGSVGYAGTFFLMILTACGIPFPSEITMPFSGFAVAEGKLIFFWVIVAGVLGDLTGALLAYWIGFKGGRPLVERYGKYILLSKHDLDTAERWFVNYGSITTFFGRMIPVIRTYISFPAGIAKMDVKKFALFTVLGAIPWLTFLTYMGTIMGENWEQIREYLQSVDLAVGVFIVLFITWYIWRHIKHSK